MRVLVTGASGFIGCAVADALRRQGHQVVRVLRNPPSGAFDVLQADFASIPSRAWWQPRLDGIDVVVNAVGIIREQGTQSFEALHIHAPSELFHASVAAGVRCIIHVSALGADASATSRYHQSKKAADDVLRCLPVDAAIVQPSLVYGPGGDSAALFGMMAVAPLLPLPGGGNMLVQPVHVDDVVNGIVALVTSPPQGVRTLAFAGPRPMPLRAYLRELRQALGESSSLRVLPVPLPLFRTAATVAGKLPGSLLDPETAKMLLAGNTTQENSLAELLGRSPREVSDFVVRNAAESVRHAAVLALWHPLLRVAVAFLWLWTGIVSLGLYPVADSYALLARVGLQGELASWALYGAAVCDFALGILTLAAPTSWRRWVWLAQLCLMGGYTLVITLFLPEQWLHPYGPISKNLPLAAAIALLWAMERPARRSR